jgi:MFS family permease
MDNPTVAVVEAGSAAAKPRPWTIFRSSPFRKLWAALTLSLLGDFFSYVALSWLVLQLTGSSLALGSVLVVQAIPRALLMVVGGALADRLSPRFTMLASMGLRALVVAPLAVLVLAGRVQLWEVYAVSLVFGVVDAMFLPAKQSILPRLVADHELEPGNAVMNVTQQASIIVGPALAGVVVAVVGTGWAFAADAACFAVGLGFVAWLPRTASTATTTTTAMPEPQADRNLGGQIAAGFRYAWADIGIRAALLIIAAVDFAAGGAFGVGLPTLAHGRFAAGAAGLGLMFAAWGLGATAGAAVAGVVQRPAGIGWLFILGCFWMGAGIVVVGFVPTLLPAAIALGIAGIATGVINTYGISWLQRRTDPQMQGRVMSLVMLASMGLSPVSYAVAGAIAEVSPTVLFVTAGGLVMAAAVGAGASRTVRAL